MANPPELGKPKPDDCIDIPIDKSRISVFQRFGIQFLAVFSLHKMIDKAFRRLDKVIFAFWNAIFL
jgi:hypothetical protein